MKVLHQYICILLLCSCLYLSVRIAQFFFLCVLKEISILHYGVLKFALMCKQWKIAIVSSMTGGKQYLKCTDTGKCKQGLIYSIDSILVG